jgi:hypothetical protein
VVVEIDNGTSMFAHHVRRSPDAHSFLLVLHEGLLHRLHCGHKVHHGWHVDRLHFRWHPSYTRRPSIISLTKFGFIPLTFSPRKVQQNVPTSASAISYQHFTSPIIHPIIGKMISSYKKLIHDLATVKIWQTAFSKDFAVWHKGYQNWHKSRKYHVLIPM